MYKKDSLIDLTPITLRKQKHLGQNKPFCPSLFLNQIDSQPKKFEEEKREKVLELEIPEDIIFPKTVRRRYAIGKGLSPQKIDQILPNIPSLSLHINMQKRNMDDLIQFQEIQTQRENTEMENINKKIKSIINSNKRQVSFQSSHVIIDEFDNYQVIQDLPTQRQQAPRRRTHLKQLTTEI
ncbi:unnamed protein product [Paramecium primaurelia]|uniref:Uncharacterized protein n=2 Tax=Paramecium TaxID=5884 RepID=A0A8S1VB39_9CILI|nr:unnamed protein product [Paramecium primaurelia]CAD8174144.1 unnamed protein product [Paramecium pentaurelia]